MILSIMLTSFVDENILTYYSKISTAENFKNNCNNNILYTAKKGEGVRMEVFAFGNGFTDTFRYLYPDATDIWNNVKDLDPRMGMCLDIGHNLRNGQDPIADLKRYKSRVFDIHLKDVTDCTKAGRAIELGRGRIDFPKFVKMLRKVGYTGCCSLEYEKDMKDPFVGIAESIGYFRAVCDTTR